MANPAVEKDDPDNPSAPSQNEYDAASGNPGNTMSPLDESGQMVQDQIGQERHDNSSTGLDDVMGLRDKVNGLVDQVDPDSREPVISAVRHLSDAGRAAQFGQHQSAAASMVHAAGALGRAADNARSDKNRTTLTRHATTAADTASKLISKNVATPAHPLAVKSWKGIPVRDL